VLIVDHGSRRAEANHVVEELAAQLRGRDPAVLVGVAHLEIAPPNVDDALAGLVSQGADTVVVYPHFLA
ncbi:MAG: cobalamin biosynthesis protein CbiX, partial [Gammaproteobacteria bacterium]|nr:cobalamin biosynthesis protein CbiX [Gammaproteobacteria bacterium]